ncbi:hypothetical protein OOT00_02205 [Desulfobotulus sp. H1]|uniref:Uncharacterized protein n=1 Tax=Desulfobotulus pelophilus TaxID=2823377 RepID=A0ABT3N5R8_9BACT|nr:hypothetical protein [Desulfobotulus pelophilus]MCW7752796.1 hypothetical protein [Desulfobotulus pelophilus]
MAHAHALRQMRKALAACLYTVFPYGQYHGYRRLFHASENMCAVVHCNDF